MSPSVRRARRLVTWALILSAVVVPCLQQYSPAAAAYTPRVARVGAAPTPQIVSAPSGLTTVRLPYQVLSGGRLAVEVRTVPRALVTLTVTFADGTALARRRRATAAGRAPFVVPVTYQPQSSAETATIVVTATLRRVGLDDSVSANVTVRQHIALNGQIKAPYALVVGRPLTFTVTSNRPNVDAQVTLTYPDRQVEQVDGTTNARGVLVKSVPTSPLHGVGLLRIGAVLSYGGVERRLAPVIVRLRPGR